MIRIWRTRKLKIRSLLTPYRLYITIALLLMLTELAVELLHPLLMAKIIDEGILKQDLSVVLHWGSVMVGISLLAFAAGIINSFYAAHVSQCFGYDIRKRIFVKVQTFSFEQLSRFPAASLITRMTNDITQLQTTLFMALRIMLRAPLLIVGAVIMSFIVNAKLASTFAFMIPVVIIMLIWMMKRGTLLYKKVQSKLDHVNDVLRENLIGMRLIKAYVRRNHEKKRFSHATNSLRDSTVTALRTIETSMPILLFIMNMAILVILWNGYSQVMNGNIQVGEVVAIVNYGLRLTSVLSLLSFIVMFLSRSRASASRISEVLNTEIDIEQHKNNEEFQYGKVTFEDVSFTYPGTDQEVLKHISFTVNPGETIALMGGTGAGKTTLFQLLPRLYEVNSGNILIDDIEISTISMRNLREQIGFVSQEAVLLTGTVKENILWGKEHATSSEIIEAAQAAQIHETIDKLPNKYETRIGQKGVNLSGGQKQRLSVARALVRKPKLLLLDDSTSALDVKTEMKLLKALRNYSCTIFLITQKVSSAQVADKILLLDDGALVAEGSHDELLKNSPLYQKIYQSQMMEELADAKATN
jgi:ATP-binding cassette, subfamily B, multidrug efflux pump